MKKYGFTATQSIIVKGYVTAENDCDAITKILASKYDDIIDEYEQDGIDEIIEIWETD